MTTCAFSYRPAACLKVEGEDAGTFLEGQFSNELRQGAWSVVYGLFLNAKGKVVADAHVLKLTEKSFLITSYFSPAGVIRQRLDEFIVADDVALQDLTPQTLGHSVWGPECGKVVQQLFQTVPRGAQFVRQGEVLIYRGRRNREENYELIGPEPLIGPLREQLRKLGGGEMDANQAEYRRIAAGIPAIPPDIGPGDLPNEGRLEEDAVSYTKGCYLGQEVMARLKNLGQVRRRLCVVQGSGTPPGPGTPLFQHEIKVGEIRSAATQGGAFLAMAMLSLLNLNQGEGLSLAPGLPPDLRMRARE